MLEKAVCMQYKIDFELTALIFLLVIVFRFFGKPRFPNKITKVFGVILICALADIVLDMFGSYIIDYSAQFPAALNYVVNIVFYSLQIVFPAVVLMYALLIINKPELRKKKSAVSFFSCDCL
jgi:hypothetical protein